jgi:hypothetical protein
MDVNTSAANLQPNSLSMAVAYRLLRYCEGGRGVGNRGLLKSLEGTLKWTARRWELPGGIKGFKEHGERVAKFYADRR